MGPKPPQNRADSVLPCARNRGAEPFWPKSGVDTTRAHARARDWASWRIFPARETEVPTPPAAQLIADPVRAPKLYWGGVWNLSVSSASSTVRRTRRPRQPATKITTLAELGTRTSCTQIPDRDDIALALLD